MSGFESRLEDDKTTKRRQKSFQSVPVNDFIQEKIPNFLILKASKAENSKIFNLLINIFTILGAKIQIFEKSSTSLLA